MKRFFTYKSLDVFQIREDRWPYEMHTHNFYELILVNKGTGRHLLNDVAFNYKPGHVFILTPEDRHDFEFNSFSVFTYIKFTETLFLEQSFLGKKLNWIKVFKDVLKNPNTIPECILNKDYEDQEKIFSLANVLLIEFQNPKRYSQWLIFELFKSIMIIVARNLSERNTKTSKVTQIEKERVTQILSFVRQNIHNQKMISRHHIAEKFHLSSGYVSVYLKKHTGIGLQQMINQTRLQTAEYFLEKSNLTINQIAFQTGFSDASHMNKIFNKYRKKNPTEYRKKHNN